MFVEINLCSFRHACMLLGMYDNYISLFDYDLFNLELQRCSILWTAQTLMDQHYPTLLGLIETKCSGEQTI